MATYSWRSSKPMLLRYIFTLPTLVAGIVWVLCLCSPSRPGATSPFWLLLMGFGGMASLLTVVYGGRFVEITADGSLLSIYKPYALFTRQRSLDLRTVRTVYYSGLRVQEKYLSFYGPGKDEPALLRTYVVPFADTDLTTFAEFLHHQAITTNF